MRSSLVLSTPRVGRDAPGGSWSSAPRDSCASADSSFLNETGVQEGTEGHRRGTQ